MNSKGHIYVFHRGKHPLMEFDSSGKFIRSIADDLFVTAHTVRVDAEDNIWTTDVGAHVRESHPETRNAKRRLTKPNAFLRRCHNEPRMCAAGR